MSECKRIQLEERLAVREFLNWLAHIFETTYDVGKTRCGPKAVGNEWDEATSLYESKKTYYCCLNRSSFPTSEKGS